MRTTVLLLAAAVALCLALPYSGARPDASFIKKSSNSQKASASASAESEESSTVVKKGGCGCGGICGGCAKGLYAASKKKASKAVASSSASSSSSFEGVNIGGGSCKKSVLTEVEIKQKYCQQKGESLSAYYKRILARNYAWTSTTDAWLKTVSIVWRDYCNLDLWYDRKYLSLVKSFYTLYYARQESEAWDTYYARLTRREAWESEQFFAKRLWVLRDCFPTYDLWFEQKWFNKYTKSLYALEFRKFEKESEEAWIKRIFTRDQYCDTTDELWAKRLFLIQEATIPTCAFWYSDKYTNYFKKFYSFYYKKQASESCDAWLGRSLVLLPGENIDKAITRIKFIKQVTGDCGCWKSDYFRKIQEAKLFQSSWLTRLQKSFFCGCGGAVCGCGGGAVSIQKSNKKTSASASSSAESSSEASQIISA